LMRVWSKSEELAVHPRGLPRVVGFRCGGVWEGGVRKKREVIVETTEPTNPIRTPKGMDTRAVKIKARPTMDAFRTSDERKGPGGTSA